MIIGGKKFDVEHETYVMGILNVTPDSFSDGGKVPDSAHGHVQRAGDGGSRKGEHVHPDEVLLELFLVLHTEALLRRNRGKGG